MHAQRQTDRRPASAPDGLGEVRRWSIVGLLCVGFIIAYIDRVTLSVSLAVPAFKLLFALGDRDRGFLSSAFFWTYAALQLPAGWIVDRFGAKKSLLVGFTLWSVTSAFTGLAQGFWMLFVLRMVLGVGESVVNPGGMRWIRFHIREERRGLAVGLYMAASKVGPAIGFPVATLLAARYGWRPMFIVLGLGGLLWIFPWAALVKDDDREIEARQRTSAAQPMLPFSAILRTKAMWGIFVGTFCYQYFVYFCMTWMPAYLVERRGLSLTSMSSYSALTFFGIAVVAVVGGWIADGMIARGGDPIRVRKAFTIAGLLLGGTELIGAFSASANVALFFAVFSLSALGLTTANYWALTQTLIPNGAVGKMVGLQNLAASLSGIVAPILTGWLKERTGSYDASFVMVGALLLIGVTSYAFVVRAPPTRGR
jgi:ACS family D-galactonate transporter-like MFS transporter